MSQPTRSSSNDAEWTKFDLLPADVMLRVNSYCDRFAALWQSHEQVSLEQFIAQLPDTDRQVALNELVDIDLHFRSSTGQTKPVSWYLEHWPELNIHWLTERIEHYANGKFQLEAPADATLVSPPHAASPFSLTQVGDYVIEGPLGTGGMGRIFRARHRLMGRQVALKVLKEECWQDAASRRRFEREVQLLAKLTHPNIVTAFDARQENGMLVLVTEYVVGEDLAKRIKRLGPANPLQAMRYIRQAASGLKYAHEQSIIHRDVKPGNLLLSQSQVVKVLDLGLARFSEPWSESQVGTQLGTNSLTSVEQVIGTPHYMAPEQARTPLQSDHRADIYSLGCSLYFLLTGAPPYAGQSSIDAIVAHWEQPTPRLPTHVNGHAIVDELADLVQSMMAKQIELRIQSMGEVIAQLDSLIQIVEAQPSPKTVDPKTLDQKIVDQKTAHPLNRRAWGGVGVAIAMLLATGFALAYFGKGKTPAPPLSTTNAGVAFDGLGDFIAVERFTSRVDRPLRIEVAAIANRQSHPANLVSWTGDPSMFIFTSEGSWGVAYQAGGEPQLIISQTPIQFGQLQLICGQWSGEELQLFIDGTEVETRAFIYPMSPTAHGLYLGGVPAGILPEEQGPRFYDGTILKVRISELNETPPEQDWRSLANRTEHTLFIFPTALAPGVD